MKPTAKSRRAPVDWEAARSRLAQLAQALDQSQRLSPQQARAVMDQRARELRRLPTATPDSSEMLEVLMFQLGGERLALQTAYVREIARAPDVTPLPGTPDVLVGVTNLRGELLAIMDLSGLLGLPRSRPGQQSYLLVLGGERNEFGVLADQIDEVLTRRLSEVLPPPGSVTGGARELLRGVTQDAVLILDGETLLADERLQVSGD